MANKKGNPNNLIKRSSNEARNKIDGRKGGIKSGKKRREIRDIRQAILIGLMSNDKSKPQYDGFNDVRTNVMVSLVTKMIKEANDDENYRARQQLIDILSVVPNDNLIEESHNKEDELIQAIKDSTKETKDVFKS